MAVQMKESIVRKIACIVVLLLGLYLGGCGNVDLGEVQAQTDRGVRTYEILPNTFELRSDTDPPAEPPVERVDVEQRQRDGE